MKHPAAIDPELLLRDCEMRRARRSGPGGQHRNKVETAVILRHRSTGVEAEAAERRSQSENKRAALKRLRLRLALEVRTQSDADKEPSSLWKSRCRGGRLSINPGHEDFPALLAEALNTVANCEWDVKSAAQILKCSTSQLVRFLKLEPRAMQQVNDHRQSQGKHRLK